MEFDRLDIFRKLYQYWSLSTNIIIIKLINAYFARNVQRTERCFVQAGKCYCLMSLLWRCSCNDWV